MKYNIPFDGVVSLTIGDVLDLTFDNASMHEFAQVIAAAIRDIEAQRPAGQTTGAGRSTE